MEDFIGKDVGGCKVEKKLGQGGMGAVYQGTQLSLGREVAIKVISEAYMTNEQAVARFEREARSVAQLNHPNIVQVYDLGRTSEGQYYIIMEFVEGRSLSEFLKTKGAFPERECLTMIRQAAKGLQAAAEKQIIHRDIKPDNLMVTVKGVVKVADFGLAKDTGSASQLTATGHVMGTPAYIAPEQGDGRVADHRSDIYSLGATLFAMLTGEMPYTGETPIAIVLQHIQAPVPDPKEKKPDLDDDTGKIVKKMMAKEPEARYQSCAELIHDIDVVLGVAKDGERLIADGGDVSFDDAFTLMDGSLLL
ncbi:MAG: serine/threonine protein kinase, partial [Planctomycetota bacterium]